MDTNKVFNDPIHSSVQMPKYCQIIINTPEFQRLRFIKQLGCTCYVFPSAVHTRFEHSIGVSHLAGKLASMLNQNDRNKDDLISKLEVSQVEIAGLCHGLGHGPFSHAFEMLPPDKGAKKWKDEKRSGKILRYLIDNNNLKKKLEEHSIYEAEINFICQLMLGFKKDEQMLHENKFYLYQIVNNSVNGVDVNTWDYIARDAHYLGLKSTFDLSRILPFVKVVNVKRGSETRREICFRDKVESNLKDMFVTRRRLHDSSYQHRVTKVITIMLKDAFQEAGDHLIFVGKGGKKPYNLLESVEDTMAFCQVNDTIVNEIMRSRSKEPGMVEAQKIIDRIHKRELYQCIDDCQHADKKMGTADPDEIKRRIEETRKSLLSSSSSKIWKADNIEVEVSHFDYESEDKKDFLDIRYYNKLSEPVPKDQPPADLPQRLQDVTVRIYSKLLVDEETLKKARADWEKFTDQQIGPMDPSQPMSAVSPPTSSNSGSGFGSLKSNPPRPGAAATAATGSAGSQSPEPEAKL